MYLYHTSNVEIRSPDIHYGRINADRVCLTNLNRQILATRKTVGKFKVDVAEERIHEINHDCNVRTYKTFYLPETQDLFDFYEYDYVVDAIDTVTGKLAIIENAKEADIPVISSMGAGNKVNPAAFEVADIYETSICPLVRVMRRECRKRGIDSHPGIDGVCPVSGRAFSQGITSSGAGT